MLMIRPVRHDDLDALYRIALETGDGGDDATPLYADGRLLGHIYAAPYAVLCPETVFVVEDASGVAGYIVGAADTERFEACLERDWWPTLRATCPDPAAIPPAARTLDQRRMHTIHHPPRTPTALATSYPSHLHINLLPRARGLGIGGALLETWISAIRRLGSAGAHLAVGLNNTRAIRFYHAHGFQAPDDIPPFGPAACWLVRGLAARAC